jgi:hypothetical protein
MDPRDPIRRFGRWMGEDPMPGHERRQVMWFGHYSLYAIATVIIGLIVLGIFGRPHGWLTLANVVLTIAWLFILLVAGPHHNRRLCERCAQATPLDPEAAARRWHLAFMVTHSKVVKFIPLMLVLAVIVVTHGVKGQPLWEYLLNSAILIPVFLVYLTAWQHTRLQPWCPFCQWGQGGDHEDAPDVPAPTASV